MSGDDLDRETEMLDEALRKAWPHAPPHWLVQAGSYFVTASTYQRQLIFDDAGKLTVVSQLLMDTARQYGWQLKAWAVLANHYHFMADSPEGSGLSLREWLREFHRRSAIEVNRLADAEGRKVWMNFRDTLITHQTSYMARLHYVHQNPVHHGLVKDAREYPWCSAAWFERCAPKSFVQSVSRFKIDRISVWDDF